MELKELRVYNMAMKLGEEVWKIDANWNYFEKDTVGKQLVRACDSISANLSVGFGRYHFKETKKNLDTIPEVHCTKPKHGLPNQKTETLFKKNNLMIWCKKSKSSVKC